MRNYKSEISFEYVNKLCDYCCQNGIDFEVYQGSLLDNYIFYDTEHIKLNKIEPRKFIIIREKYLNEWNSTFEMIMTDDEGLVEKYIEMFKEVA